MASFCNPITVPDNGRAKTNVTYTTWSACLHLHLQFLGSVIVTRFTRFSINKNGPLTRRFALFTASEYIIP